MVDILLKNHLGNPLTEEEIAQYFSIVDLDRVSVEQRNQIRKGILAFAEKSPYARKLIRDKIKDGKRIFLTDTPDDATYFKENDCAGVSFGDEARISLNSKDMIPDDWKIVTFYHEVLHTNQSAKKLWLSDETREMSTVANKLNEAEAVSVNYLLSSGSSYFNKLKQQNIEYVTRTIRETDIPYNDNLSSQQKNEARTLYINYLAEQRTVGQSIDILMQPNGKETVQTALKYNVVLTSDDINNILNWRNSYNEQALQSSNYLASEEDTGISEQQKAEKERIKHIFEKRYPVLKSATYFQDGLSSKEAFENNIVQQKEISSGFEMVEHDNIPIYTACRNKNGELDGEEIYSDEQNNVLILSHYKQGKLDGSQQFYKTDEKTGVRYLFQENNFINGKKTRAIYKYPSGQTKQIEKYTYSDKNEKPIVTCFCYQENGTLYEKYSYQGNEFVGEAYYFDEKKKMHSISKYSEDGKIISRSVYDNKENLVKTQQAPSDSSDLLLETNYETGKDSVFKNIFPFKNNKIKSQGFVLEKNGIPIGRWEYQDKSQEKKVRYYNASQSQESEKSDNPADFVMPIQDYSEKIKSEGYIQNKKEKYRYDKMDKSGKIYSVYLDNHTLLPKKVGCFSKNDIPVGKWTFYRVDGSCQGVSQYDNEGNCQFTCFYAEDGKTKLEETQKNNDGTFYEITYYGDVANTIRSVGRYTLKGENKNYHSYTTYYIDGSEKEKGFGQYCIQKSIDGQKTFSTFSVGKNIRISKSYYEDSSSLKTENVSFYNTTLSTTYRKDGTVMQRKRVNKDGTGSCSYYDVQGNLRAFGSLEKYQKNGVWTIQTQKGEVQESYQKGKRVRRSEDNEVKTESITSKESHLLDVFHQNASSCQEKHNASSSLDKEKDMD